MSQVKKFDILGLLLIIGVLSAMGCGTPNSQSTFDADSQKHSAGWLPAGHMAAARADKTVCAECHGSDLTGGISATSCSQCHLGGADSVHPEAWGQMTGTAHGAYVKTNGDTGDTSCANASCHGTTLSGVAGSGPSCSSCHLGGAASVHPQDWGTIAYYKHAVYVNANGTASCSNGNCHGATLGGIAGSGPSCTKCHLGGLNAVHPSDWDQDITLHADYVASNGSASCSIASCHGAGRQGVWLSGPNCYTCH